MSHFPSIFSTFIYGEPLHTKFRLSLVPNKLQGYGELIESMEGKRFEMGGKGRSNLLRQGGRTKAWGEGLRQGGQI